MENIFKFVSDYSTIFHIIVAIGFTGIGIMIARMMPPKKPKTYGELHIIHYPNESKQLYLKLESDIENFEKNDQVSFIVINDDVAAY